MNTFARITNQHDSLLSSVSPCARFLYNWLLRRRPAGMTQEIYLAEFQEWSGDTRIRAYCMRQIQNALKELTEIELVKIAVRYTGKIFKLIARHPDAPKEEKNFPVWNKISKTGHSNPDGYVPIYRDLEETTTPTVVTEQKQDVVVFEKPKLKKKEASPQIEVETPKLNTEQEEILQEAKELGVQVTKPLIKEVLKATGEIFRDAVNSLKERKSQNKVKSPTGFLLAAIRGWWKPNGANEHTAPDGFKELYDQAYRDGLVRGSQLIDGVQYVYDRNYQRHRWEDFRSEEAMYEPSRK